MPRPARWRATLDAAVSEACLAVRLYNDPAESRAFEGFVVHMHMAWLYLLHAVFVRDGVDFRYRDPHNPRRLQRIDGEPRCWELKKCAEEHWPSGGAVSANLDFFIRLRNRFEHRHAPTDSALAVAVSGHSHAHLVNFEEELTRNFGTSQSMATRLRFPVFVGTFTDAGEEALRRLRSTLPKDLQRFITEYHSGLDDSIAHDQHFEIRLRVTLELADRDPDATAIQFTRMDDLTDEQRAVIEEMGRHGQVVVREQNREVYNLGLLRPQQAVARVDAAIPFTFRMAHFVGAWQETKIRPPGDSDHPERVDERYCVYNSLNGNYGYKDAWVTRLIRKCQTEEGFKAITGYQPD